MRLKMIQISGFLLVLIVVFQNCDSAFMLNGDFESSSIEKNDNNDKNLNDIENTNEPPVTIIKDDEVPYSLGDNFYVNKSGNDKNDCTNNKQDACLTLQKGFSVLSAGDTLNIGEGVYSDNARTSPYLKSGTPAYFGSSPKTAEAFILVFDKSGTKTKPITIQANPNNSKPVILDGGNVYNQASSDKAGIFVYYQDYIHIKNLTLRNMFTKGIANWDHTGSVEKSSNISIGVRVEGCTFYHMGGGDNDSAIAMWSTKNWVVKNNHIYDIYGKPAGNTSRGAQGIQSYGTINALIEHNLIEDVSVGIFWKDHYVLDEQTREPTFESEVRYNRIKARDVAFMISIQGTKSEEAGENYIHHNIFEGASNSGARGLRISTAGVKHPTTALQRYEHNLIVGSNSTDSSGIFLSGTTNVQLKGNIILNFNRALESAYVSTDKHVGLNKSDYNVFGSNISKEIAVLDRYSSDYTTQAYKTLNDWQNAMASQSLSLGFNSPDSKSVQAAMSAIVSNDGKYSYPANSPARGIMPDGSNAGPYQFGNEVIGPIK